MQLIFETKPTIGIGKEMSALDETQTINEVIAEKKKEITTVCKQEPIENNVVNINTESVTTNGDTTPSNPVVTENVCSTTKPEATKVNGTIGSVNGNESASDKDNDTAKIDDVDNDKNGPKDTNIETEASMVTAKDNGIGSEKEIDISINSLSKEIQLNSPVINKTITDKVDKNIDVSNIKTEPVKVEKAETTVEIEESPNKNENIDLNKENSGDTNVVIKTACIKVSVKCEIDDSENTERGLKSVKQENLSEKQLSEEQDNVTDKQLSEEEENVTEKQLSKEEQNVTEKQLSKEEENVTEKQLSEVEENVTDKQLSKEEENETEKQLCEVEDNVSEKQLSKEEENVTDKQLSTEVENVTDKQLSGEQENITDEQLSEEQDNIPDEQLSEVPIDTSELQIEDCEESRHFLGSPSESKSDADVDISKDKEEQDSSQNLSTEYDNVDPIETELKKLLNESDSPTVANVQDVIEDSKVDECMDVDSVADKNAESEMDVDETTDLAAETVKNKSVDNAEKNKAETDENVSEDKNNVIEILDQEPTSDTDKPNETPETNAVVCDKSEEQKNIEKDKEALETEKINDKIEILDEDDIKIVEESKPETAESDKPKEKSPDKTQKPLPVVCKLSNTLDILSDEEEEPVKPTVCKLSNMLDILSDDEETPAKDTKQDEKKSEETPVDKCIDIDDDDDIMLIEDAKDTEQVNEEAKDTTETETSDKSNVETSPKETDSKSTTVDVAKKVDKSSEKVADPKTPEIDKAPVTNVKARKKSTSKITPKRPLLSLDFLKSAKKNLADMTRDELEEFCILKVVESIVDRSSLGDIKTKMKALEELVEEHKKKATVLTKQNRDLQLVLKSVQEEMKTRPNSSITPLKITRSVGVQVLMIDKAQRKTSAIVTRSKSPTRTTPRVNKHQSPNTIPVPRLIPASNSPAKAQTGSTSKTPNGLKATPKMPEKRPMTRQATAMTVDLTDDEPPSKVNKPHPVPPVRLIPAQNLLTPRNQMSNNPRKVYIPISTPQNIRPGQSVLLRGIPAAGQRPRMPVPVMPGVVRAPGTPSTPPTSATPGSPGTPGTPGMPGLANTPQNLVRINQVPSVTVHRHPAPLPDGVKQYQPPTWKPLPPAPDLKLSKVDNGIVISWKIEGYHESLYEKIASYQLYAYQETPSPPSTTLWKKIGDVKALPLPMACTLTQFMAGYKYYFAVRAVDIRSRLGPFSVPGSILLLNKV